MAGLKLSVAIGTTNSISCWYCSNILPIASKNPGAIIAISDFLLPGKTATTAEPVFTFNFCLAPSVSGTIGIVDANG